LRRRRKFSRKWSPNLKFKLKNGPEGKNFSQKLRATKNFNEKYRISLNSLIAAISSPSLQPADGGGFSPH
jgi:hypothetical protein